MSENIKTVVENVEGEVAEHVETKVAEPELVKAEVIKFGVVSNCEKLNVRNYANVKSKILCVINKGDKVKIDDAKSTKDFYKVILKTGAEGFCMKKYITVRQ